MINCGAAPPVKVMNPKQFTNDIRRWFVQFMALSVLASVPLLALQTENSGGPLRADQACFDVQHYELILVVVPESKKIGASLTMTARMEEASDKISLDLDSRFTVRRVTVGGVEVEASHKDGRIEIPLPEGQGRASQELQVNVLYMGTPREAPNAPWVGGFTWAKTPSGADWISTTCQMEGADLWWPCKDHPSDKPESFDLKVTIPAGLVCASNGRLMGVQEGGNGARTFHWHTSMPIANYSISLNIAPYETISRTVEGIDGDMIPVTFWHLPENAEKAKVLFEEIVDHLKHLESVCGPYPFHQDKYGVVETPHLGMEHQTIIGYGNNYSGDPEFDYDWLHHHEMSHEWWSNLLTCVDWADFWIHEGLGTYMQALYLESRFGPEAYRKKMAIDWRRIGFHGAIAPAAPRGTQSMYFAGGVSDAPGGDIYFKGSWVVHNLRWLIGDEDFFKLLREWARPGKGGKPRFVSTNELIQVASRQAGQDLGWYFDVVLKEKQLPRLVADVKDGVLHLEWTSAGKQTYNMPVEVLVGDKRVRVECPGGEGMLPVAQQEWQLDPDRWLIR
ncbi:MAG TPA: M1 family peptidase [Planctomycetes bacterium]|nr:M1 family peptidase [Planctomycetota bacterium]HIL36711.1 M1 family peptidase [Planctomycetota bacterium]